MNTNQKGDAAAPELIKNILWIRDNFFRHPWLAAIAILILLILGAVFFRERLMPPVTVSQQPQEPASQILDLYVRDLVSELRNARESSHGDAQVRLAGTIRIAAERLHPVDAVIGGRQFSLSAERGQLLSTLIAERYSYHGDSPLPLSHAVLSSMPPFPLGDESQFPLGNVDLSFSDASNAQLSGYDLTSVNFHGSVLPEAAAFKSSILRIVEWKADFGAPINGANLEGAEVPSANWLRDIEGVVGFKQFAAINWIVASENGHHIVHRNPDPDLAGAEEQLSRRAVATAERCMRFGNDEPTALQGCESFVKESCDATTRLLRKQSLTAEQRGTLFAFAVDAAHEAGLRAFRLRVGVFDQFEQLEACVYNAALDGKAAVDVSRLHLQFLNLRNRDLRGMVWKDARIEGYFQGALLPSHERFVEAHAIFPRASGRGGEGLWDNAIVPTKDWVYQVCLSRAAPLTSAKDGLIELDFFPFSSMSETLLNNQYVLMQTGTPHCRESEGWPKNESAAARRQFCDKCAMGTDPQ